MNEEEKSWYGIIVSDLIRAVCDLDLRLPRIKEKGVREGLINNAIMAYVRPFTNCRSKDRTRIYKLNPKDVLDLKPEKQFHKEVINYRNQVCAHTDMAIRECQIGRGAMSYNGFDPEKKFDIESLRLLLIKVHWKVQKIRKTLHPIDSVH